MPLFLLPNALHSDAPESAWLVPAIRDLVPTLQGLIAESEAGARLFLKRFKVHVPVQLLNEHTRDIDFILEPVLKGERWGLISDAGLPCIADPGAALVYRARVLNIAVETFTGPSSLLFALQLSGLPAQQFSFHGYPPRETEELKEYIRLKEREKGVTHLWIEAPYRSARLLSVMLETLSGSTRLSVAASLGSPQQRIVSRQVSDWKPFALEKEPAVFLLFSEIGQAPIRRKTRER